MLRIWETTLKLFFKEFLLPSSWKTILEIETICGRMDDEKEIDPNLRKVLLQFQI